jgi:TPR repeat protein
VVFENNFKNGRRMFRLIRCAALALALAPSAGHVQDLEAGLAAAQAGDFATALREWTPLAAQGNAAAQFNLGVAHYVGLGVPQDFAEAEKWLRLAAEQGHADAQSYLGVMYYVGLGVPQDTTEALIWYRLAAEQGVADAQYFLGLMYKNDRGVPQNDITAYMWTNIAAENGAEKAEYLRETLAAKMTPADVSSAQKRARACMESNYQDCD